MLFLRNKEEADTIIILHALDAVKRGLHVHIESPDTDVFILAASFGSELGRNVCFITGTRDHRRTIPIYSAYTSLGFKKSKALPGFHAFNVCDTCGHFYRRGKLSCWKTFMTANETVTNAFIKLGQGLHLSTETESGLELFVCNVYIRYHYLTLLLFRTCSGIFSKTTLYSHTTSYLLKMH